MYANLKSLFFWHSMKQDVVDYVAKCLECQLVKVEHNHLTKLLQHHAIPETKSEVISMDFIVGLSMTSRRHDSILMGVDTLTKSAHFIQVKANYQALDIAHVFINEVV